MSDLVGGRPTAPISEEVIKEGVAQRPRGYSSSYASMKGPREVMRERSEREARRKIQIEQLEVLERERAVEELRLLEERRKSVERRAAATAGTAANITTEGGERQSHIQYSTPIQKKADDKIPLGYDRTLGQKPSDRSQGEYISGNSREGPASTRDQSAADRLRAKPIPPDSSRPNRSGATSTTTHNNTRSSFPHAFERWETLSAHWEGLTSFWIRRLEENSNDINRDPLSQQLSRQVTDLSAAGANLFHAVVELQRLRASSERKFQRWFFETRSEQERNQEIQAAIEKRLQAEISARDTAVANAAACEREKKNSERRLAEMKRELQISKEEARRAWEELGRREQEERARTISLREGLPTVMGGVQVVPMMPGTVTQPITTLESKHVDSPNPPYRTEAPNDESVYQTYSRSPPEPTNPFPESTATRRTPVSRPAGGSNPSLSRNVTPTNIQPQTQAQPLYPTTKTFYQHSEGTSLEPIDTRNYKPPTQSEASFSDENDEDYPVYDPSQLGGNAQESNSGFQAVEDCLSEIDDVMKPKDTSSSFSSYAPMSGVEYGRGSTDTAGYPNITGANSVPAPEISDADAIASYSGYNLGTEWTYVPRHHHPTRLSDVTEEDERSRTSASQVSRT